MKKYWIRPIPLCRGERDGSTRTYMMNFGKTTETCAYSWYIEGSEPKILVDAGCQADLLSSHHGFSSIHIQTIEEGLQKLGLKPEDIGIVIFSHLHGDHAMLAQKFPQAKFIVQKAELEAVLHPHPYTAAAGFYNKEWLANLNIETIEGDKEIIDGVNVILTPGHSPGGQSIVIDTLKGPAVITGFCSSFENFNPPPASKAKGLEVIPPGRHINVFEVYDSMIKVKRTGYIIIPIHEVSFIGKDRLPL